MFLRAERKLSQKMSTRLLEAITNLTGEDREILRAEVDASFQAIDLSPDDSEILASSWHYFAVLSLAEVESFRSEPTWIGDRLNISAADAEFALATLFRLKMLIEKNGWIVPSGYRYTAGGNVKIRAGHARTLELGAKKLSELEDPAVFAASDFSSVIVATNHSLLPELKDRIKRFRRSLIRVAEKGVPTDVVVLAIQLLPVTVQPQRQASAQANLAERIVESSCEEHGELAVL